MAQPSWYDHYLATVGRAGSDINNWYIDVTDGLSSVTANLTTIERTTTGGLKLTAASETRYLNAVKSAEKEIRKGVNQIIRTTTTESLDLSKGVQDRAWIRTMKEYLDLKILNDLSKQTTDYVNKIQFKKIYKHADGKIGKYANSVWEASNEYRRSMTSILRNGLRNGRDVVTIAADLDAYAIGGRSSLARRYAGIGDDPFEWAARIPKNVDYRSLRLARTVIQSAVQDGQVASNEINPGATGFNWVLSPLHKRYSVCEDIVAGNSHTYDNFMWSLAPHPNCMSHAEDILIPRSKFNKDLKTWTENPTDDSVGYLNTWKGKYYDPIENGGTIELTKLLSRNVQEALR